MADRKTCPHCKGTGIGSLSRAEQRVLDFLRREGRGYGTQIFCADVLGKASLQYVSLVLRRMEAAGLVTSAWERGPLGVAAIKWYMPAGPGA